MTFQAYIDDIRAKTGMLGVPGTLLGMTLVTADLWRRPDWRSGRPKLLTAVGLVWLTMIVFGVSMAALMSQGASGPEFVIGWQNRALVAAWALWILAVGLHARSAATWRGGWAAKAE